MDFEYRTDEHGTRNAEVSPKRSLSCCSEAADRGGTGRGYPRFPDSSFPRFRTLLLPLLLLLTIAVQAQDRFTTIETKLKDLAKESPGLNEKVELSVNGVSIQDFIRSLATTNNLNISVDAGLTTKIHNNFSNVNVADVLLFLCRKYDLELSFIGSIMSFSQYAAPPEPPKKYVSKPFRIVYNKETNLLSYDLNNDSLALVVKELTRQTGKNVVFAPDLTGKMVSGFIQDMAFASAMDKLAFANDLKITQSEENKNVYLVEKKEKENASEKSAKKSPYQQTPGLSFKLQEGKVSVNAVNVPIADVIAAISKEMGHSYFLFSEPKGNATLSITDAGYDDFLRYLLNGTEFTFRKEGDIYLMGDRGLEGLRATRVVQLKYRTIDKVMEVIPAEIKKGVDIKEFPDLNSLILSGSQPRIDEIEAFLRDIDKVVPVVLIEVIIMDVRDSKTLSTGLKAGLGTAPAKTGGTVYPTVDLTISANTLNEIISGVNGFGLVNLGKVTPNFYLSLKALEEQGVLKMRSTPKLTALNGVEAKMGIIRQEYYLEISNNVIGTQNPQNIISQQYKPVNADFSLTVNPMVSGDEQITMDIKVKQASFTERISPNAPPGTISRDFQSTIRVKNEETVILGGLEENSTNDTGSGLPLLSRVPVVKWLFSSRTKARSKNKLTVFIKATVLHS